MFGARELAIRISELLISVTPRISMYLCRTYGHFKVTGSMKDRSETVGKWYQVWSVETDIWK